MHRTLTIVALALAGLFACTTSPATADTITVCASGCHYTSIRTAINNASDGDVIQLAAETYIEGDTIEIDADIELTIIGEVDSAGDPATIISGNNQQRVMRITAGTVRFEDLQIVSGRVTQGMCPAGGGARIDDADTSFVNCWIRDCYASATGPFGVQCGSGGGLAVFGTGSLRLEGCRFEDNMSDLKTSLSLRVEIIDCVFTEYLGIGFRNYASPIWVFDEAPIAGDLDGDGDYDEDDARIAMADFGITEGTPGDMDGDDDADVADFALLRNQIGVDKLGCVGSDINGDGTVNGADLAYILSFWGATCP